MQILLAVDGSLYTEKMLEYLVKTGALLQKEQHSFTVLSVQQALPMRVRAALGKEAVDKFYATEAEKILNPVKAFLEDNGFNGRTIYKVGNNAGEVIAKVADSGEYDLLIMGSHGQGALANLVMGSVTAKVLASSKIPLLLVR